MNHEIHTIAIDGATGGIGSQLVKKAVLEHPDKRIIALGRDQRKLESLGVEETRIYNLNDSLDTLRKTLAGVDSVIHLAGRTNEENDYEAHDRDNRLATENLATVAAEMGLAFIYTGSTAQYTDNPLGKEIGDGREAFSNAAYGGSKVNAHKASQRLATQEATERGYKPIQVVPGMTIGPNTGWVDFLTKSGFRISVMERFMRDTEIGWSNIDDVTDLLINIAVNPYVANSERYLAVNGMADTNELFAFFADLRNEYMLPPFRNKAVEPIGKTILKLAGKKAPISPQAFSFGLHGHERRFTPEAAREDYKWEPKTLQQTFSDIRESYKQQK